MVRPRRCRRIFFQPDATYFKPAGVSLRHLDENILAFDEAETLRLIDVEEMPQEDAARKMNISQPTLSRLLKSGRKKLADSVINSKSIRIQGGIFKMAAQRGRGLGGGRMGRFAAGPGGNCICPKCGHKSVHKIGTPCYQQKCPKCQSTMVRE
ncbi:MAG: DUF134 domain-containing protein [archaeon]